MESVALSPQDLREHPSSQDKTMHQQQLKSSDSAMTGGHFCWSLCLDLANILLLPAKNTLIVKNSSFGQYTAFCKPSKRPTSAFKYVILEKSLKFHSLKKKLRLKRLTPALCI